MTVEILINDDQTLSVNWIGKKGRSSLYFIMAQGNAKELNQLDKEECIAIYLCAKETPFPCGGENTYYLAKLKILREECQWLLDEKLLERYDKYSLGSLRKFLVELSGDSCNGPVDTYIRVAIACKNK